MGLKTLEPSKTHTHTHNRLTALWPGLPGWAGTRRIIHPLTSMLIISYPLSTSSICYDPWHPPCLIYLLDGPLPQPLPGPLWSSSWSGTLWFILHTFLYQIIIFKKIEPSKSVDDTNIGCQLQRTHSLCNINVWNSLPPKIVDFSSLRSFRTEALVDFSSFLTFF